MLSALQAILPWPPPCNHAGGGSVNVQSCTHAYAQHQGAGHIKSQDHGVMCLDSTAHRSRAQHMRVNRPLSGAQCRPSADSRGPYDRSQQVLKTHQPIEATKTTKHNRTHTPKLTPWQPQQYRTGQTLNLKLLTFSKGTGPHSCPASSLRSSRYCCRHCRCRRSRCSPRFQPQRQPVARPLDREILPLRLPVSSQAVGPAQL